MKLVRDIVDNVGMRLRRMCGIEKNNLSSSAGLILITEENCPFYRQAMLN